MFKPNTAYGTRYGESTMGGRSVSEVQQPYQLIHALPGANRQEEGEM